MRLKRILRFVQILYDKTHLLRHECPCPYIVPGMRQGFIQFVIPFYPPRQGADGATCSSIGAIEACQIFLFISRDTKAIFCFYNPQIQISVVSGTKRSIFRQKNKTKRSKKRLHTTLIKPEQKVNEDLCSGFIVS